VRLESGLQSHNLDDLLSVVLVDNDHDDDDPGYNNERLLSGWDGQMEG